MEKKDFEEIADMLQTLISRKLTEVPNSANYLLDFIVLIFFNNIYVMKKF